MVSHDWEFFPSSVLVFIWFLHFSLSQQGSSALKALLPVSRDGSLANKVQRVLLRDSSLCCVFSLQTQSLPWGYSGSSCCSVFASLLSCFAPAPHSCCCQIIHAARVPAKHFQMLLISRIGRYILILIESKSCVS